MRYTRKQLREGLEVLRKRLAESIDAQSNDIYIFTNKWVTWYGYSANEPIDELNDAWTTSDEFKANYTEDNGFIKAQIDFAQKHGYNVVGIGLPYTGKIVPVDEYLRKNGFSNEAEDTADEMLAKYNQHIQERFRQISPDNGQVSVKDILDAMDNVFPGQENSVLNFSPEGKILGQVNCIFSDKQGYKTFCVMTLSPYKNGRRYVDCSIAGNKNPPLNFQQIKRILNTLNPSTVIKIRYADPLAFGPKAGQIVEQFVEKIVIDKYFGIFLRPNDESKTEFQPNTVNESKKIRYTRKQLHESIRYWNKIIKK